MALEAKKSVEAKLNATETKLMSANEEVMKIIIDPILMMMMGMSMPNMMIMVMWRSRPN